MSQAQYINVPPNTTKAVYSPYDDIKMTIKIPAGMEYVKQSGYLLADYSYSVANTIIAHNQAVYFDNYAGCSCFIENPRVKMGSVFVESDFNYYSEYNKLVTEVSVHPDELTSQTKHTMELKCADPTQTREYLRVNYNGANGDLTGSFSHLLRSGINRTNRNFNSSDIGGDIEIQFSIKDNLRAFFGADITLANTAVEFYNIRFQFLVRPISQSGLLTMKTTACKRYEVATGNAYFEYILPVPTVSISSYFSTPALLANNPYSSLQPAISEVIYTFNNSNNDILSYNLTDTNEMVMNFKRSLLKAVDVDANSFSGPRLSSATQSTFGLGLNFETAMPTGTKVGVNIYSDSSNVQQRVMYTFFNGEVVIQKGSQMVKGKPVVTTTGVKPMTASLPLNFGQTGDIMQTNELVPRYHSQTRTEWVIDDYTILSDLRLSDLTATTAAGRLVYLTGLAGLIKNIYLYADGKVLLSSIQGNNAHRYYAMKQLLRANRANKNVQDVLDGSFWGFKNVLGVTETTLQITEDTMHRSVHTGDSLGRIELKNLLPILSQMEYLHFKQLKLVIEWNSANNTDRSNVYIQADAGQAVVVNPPTLLFERIMPDRPLSEAVFWDVLVDSLTQDQIPLGAGNATKTTDYFIQAFNNKTVDNIVIINDTGLNAVLGNNVAHAKYHEQFNFLDGNNVPLLPNIADSNELQKMMVDAYGSMNIPMLLDKNAVGVGQVNQGDELFDANILQFLHTGSWKCLPLNGRKLNNLKLQYTRTNFDVTGNDNAFNQIFIGKVLKAITFDAEGKAVTSFV